MKDESKNNDYGHATVGAGTSTPKELKIIDFLQATFKNNRLASVTELEDGAFGLAIENPPSSGRSNQTMLLSKESLLAVVSVTMLFLKLKGLDFDVELEKALGGSDSIDYACSENLIPKKEETPTAPTEPSIHDHKGERVITWDKLDRIEKPSPHLKFTWSCPYCGKRTNELCTTTPTGLAEVTCANDECEAFMYLEKLKED